MSNSSWSLTTKTLYNAVLIQACCGAVAALISVVISIQLMTADSLRDLSNIVDSSNFWGIIQTIAGVGSLVGFVLFFMNIDNWKKLVNPNDAPAIVHIRTSLIISIVCAALTFINAFVGSFPFTIIVFIAGIVALVFQIMGYNALKNSTTFPELARQGANKIFTAIIISLVAGFVSGLLLLGTPFLALLAYLAVIYSWVMQIQGWSLIAKSEQPK